MVRQKSTEDAIERQYQRERGQCERKVRQLTEAVARLANRPLVRRLQALAEKLYALRTEAEDYLLSIDDEIFSIAGELAEFLAEAPELPKYLPR